MRGKILIIENQIRQFEDISRMLTNNKYEVYPEAREFKNFIDAIRVYLNPRYSCDRRASALEDIWSMIKGFSPDILIIDHILVGNDSSENGIDLAVKFREKGLAMPIAFFSRTVANDFFIIENLPKVEEIKVWLPKAYWGGTNLDDSLFKNKILPELDKLIEKSGVFMTDNFVSKEMLPFLKNIKKERQNLYAVAEKAEVKKALESLESLVKNIEQFQEGKGLIVGAMKDGFARLEKLSRAGLFEEEEWVSACCELSKLFEYD